AKTKYKPESLAQGITPARILETREGTSRWPLRVYSADSSRGAEEINDCSEPEFCGCLGCLSGCNYRELGAQLEDKCEETGERWQGIYNSRRALGVAA